MPHFVLLFHVCPNNFERPSHWDLMLEAGDRLRTWALAELPRAWHVARAHTAALQPNCPPLATRNEVSALELNRHRRAYLDYEGPVSGNRGRVVRIDGGTYSVMRESSRLCAVKLAGSVVQGTIELQQVTPGAHEWTLIATKD
jgi:hypothetical protein